ncbi:MAG: hypothetical protein JXR46_01605 [Calditrichaceae bacterium]|nr:hypothetical protein [Calditrichaceae bacterium]MBN2707714.1 hypothetical protein [Calditrichaceae bacterium]RQV96470.1 MAG: hypothetical protein EH224_04435 [Calditrichota bacterium]
MKKLTLLFVLSVLMVTWSCGSKSEDKPAAKEETQVTLKRNINNQDEFNKALEELGIPIYPDVEFIKFEATKPVGTPETDPPNVFKCYYKLSGNNYSQNQKDVLAYYKKLYEEKLKEAGWRDTSIKGTGVLNFHPAGGDFPTVSFHVTDSDYAKQIQNQELSITLFVKKQSK